VTVQPDTAEVVFCFNYGFHQGKEKPVQMEKEDE
jgi:hypothetical protein